MHVLRNLCNNDKVVPAIHNFVLAVRNIFLPIFSEVLEKQLNDHLVKMDWPNIFLSIFCLPVKGSGSFTQSICGCESLYLL